MKKIICLSILFIIFTFRPAFAMKVENVVVDGDFHLGLVSGPGVGLNFGAKMWFPLKNLKLGLEIEQVITDVNYYATINALRLGGLLSFRLSPETSLNGHIGTFGFISNKTFNFKDSAGQQQGINENTNYKGQYWAVSLDYQIWDFIILPKYAVNIITEKGSLTEFDLNISKSF